jgi:voltage-gated potassium channel
MRARLDEIIFEVDTRAGKAFDVALLALILASVLAVVLDSVAPIRQE